MQTKLYIAFLRGINVGGHHKVPMAELRKEMEHLGFENASTLLNSGNVLFDGNAANESTLEEKIAIHLEKIFGFPIPVLIKTAEDIRALLHTEPFQKISITKDIRLYVSFLKEKPQQKLSLPWISEDKSFRIIQVQNRMICSIVDLSIAQTPKAMAALEKIFSKDITTRNWNTVLRIGKKLG